jgi:iron complex transport system substrate-binding protein
MSVVFNKRIVLVASALGALLLLALVFQVELRPAMLGAEALRTTQVEGEGFPKRFIDPAGIVHELKEPPQRIVSTALAGDEFLASLVDPHRVVGVTYLVDDPQMSEAHGLYPASIRRVGVDVEEVLSLEPDLVIVATYTRASTVRLLVGAGVPVLRLGPLGSFAEVEENLRLVSSVVGEEARAEQRIESLRLRIAEVEAMVQGRPRPRVLVWGRSGFAKGINTLMDEVIESAGGANVMRETGFSGPAKISIEFAMGLEPDIILMEGGSLNGVEDAATELLSDPLWSEVPAVRAGRVYDHNEPASSSVTQYRVSDVETVARLIHPEVFER